MIKRLLLVASTNKRLEKLVSTHQLTRGSVSRFVAGTTLADAIAVTRELKAQNIDVSLDLLGETVDDLAESAIATKSYIEAVHAIAENRLGATVSVKLSQLGIGVDPAVCAGHLGDLLRAAAEVGVRVEVDMEHSSVGPATLEAFRAALGEHPDTRVAIQAAMRRTPQDLESFTGVKPRIRLVKGAFLEPIEKSLQERQEITAQPALRHAVYPYLMRRMAERPANLLLFLRSLVSG